MAGCDGNGDPSKNRCGYGSVYAPDRADDAGVKAVDFRLLQGKSPSERSHVNDEVVMLVDWVDASGWALSYTPTATIAAIVKPYLLNAIPNRGIAKPLAETPIHLIGHSRGGSMVTALATSLGAQGIWVDQLTLLDPYPFSPTRKPKSVQTCISQTTTGSPTTGL